MNGANRGRLRGDRGAGVAECQFVSRQVAN